MSSANKQTQQEQNLLSELAIGIGGNLATNIVLRQLDQVKDNVFGQVITKLGILEPGFETKLKSALAKGAEEYFQAHPDHRLEGVTRFLQDPSIAREIGNCILNGEPVNFNTLRTRLADELDLPVNAPNGFWPRGIDPIVLLGEFVRNLHTALAREADPGILWIGTRLTDVSQSLDALNAKLSLLDSNAAHLFDKAAQLQQNETWKKFESSFLDHMGTRFGKLTTPGVREFRDVKQSLSLAYISLNVKESGSAEPLRAEQFLAENRLIVVRGPAGSGKTTLLNWIAWNCSGKDGNNSEWSGGVPFFIPLRTIARTESGAPQVVNLVDYAVDRKTWAHKEPDGWLMSILSEQKRAILMIDGVDELPPSRRASFWEWVANFIEQYPGNRVIITSRTLPRSATSGESGRSEQWNPPIGFIDAHLEEMSATDIVRFIEHWHLSVEAFTSDDTDKNELRKARDALIQKITDPANRRIRELCSTPLLCAIVCVLHWKEEGFLPRQRVELYDRCCEMLIEARDKKRDIQVTSGPLSSLTKNDKEFVLQRLAFEMMINKPDGDELDETTYRIEISREKAIQWIEPWIKNFSEANTIKPEDLLNHLIERTSLLREPASGLIDYPHRTFQEYLAACAAGAQGLEDFLA